MQSAKKYFTRSFRKKEFELFGYDFLVDEDLKVWLIEVNNNPYLGCPNNFIKELLPNMVDEMLEIIIDPYYRPASYTPVAKKNFEMLYKETSSFRINPLRSNSSDNRKNAKSILEKTKDKDLDKEAIVTGPLVPNTLRHKRKTELISLSNT